MEVSRRSMLVGMGAIGTVPSVKASEWGTGHLVSWNKELGYGVYRSDRGGGPRMIVLRRPFPASSLSQGERIDLQLGKVVTRDGAELCCKSESHLAVGCDPKTNDGVPIKPVSVMVG